MWVADLECDFDGFSTSVAVAVPPADALPQSKAVPGVLGVLVADPKEAKAPDPNPNAEDFPGGAEALVFSGVMPFEREGRLFPTSLEDSRVLGSGRPELSLERSVLCLNCN